MPPISSGKPLSVAAQNSFLLLRFKSCLVILFTFFQTPTTVSLHPGIQYLNSFHFKATPTGVPNLGLPDNFDHSSTLKSHANLKAPRNNTQLFTTVSMSDNQAKIPHTVHLCFDQIQHDYHCRTSFTLLAFHRQIRQALLATVIQCSFCGWKKAIPSSPSAFVKLRLVTNHRDINRWWLDIQYSSRCPITIIQKISLAHRRDGRLVYVRDSIPALLWQDPQPNSTQDVI